MRKRNYKKKHKFLNERSFIFFLSQGIIIFLILVPHFSHAQNVTSYQSQEKIPGAGGQAMDFMSYIRQVIGFGYAVIGILAMFMLAVGAYLYLMSAGNLAKVESAKNVISSAILGLILGLMSFVILRTINPDLVTLRGINLSGLQLGSLSTQAPSITSTGGGGTGYTGGSGGATIGAGQVTSGNATLDQVAQNLAQNTIYKADRGGWIGGIFYGDCSSWAQEFYREAYGINPGGSTSEMLKNANGSTDPSTLRPGDLLIVNGSSGATGHAVIYMGGNSVIGNSGTGRNVVYGQLSNYNIAAVIKAPV